LPQTQNDPACQLSGSGGSGWGGNEKAPARCCVEAWIKFGELQSALGVEPNPGTTRFAALPGHEIHAAYLYAFTKTAAD